jgi:hypothetical protein
VGATGRTTVIVRTAPKRPLAALNDADRAAMIITRIRTRCPELSAADLLLAARAINASKRRERRRGG